MEEFDYIIVGSGFGGSVSAMRLTQKGYKVAVIESGKRWKSEDFPKTNFSVRKFAWLPKVFCYGIQRINFLDDVVVLSGAGVGGGSLVYANTLYVPPKPFFEHHVVQKMGAESTLLPLYELAKKMLGVVENPKIWEVDDLMKATADEFGVGHTFKKTPVGINFHAKDGVDPYFEGEGPARNGCNYCGGCMVGCRFNSKNTLDKNYLYFAEQLGATIIPETKVVKLVPLSEDGSEGYEVHTVKTTGLFGFPRKKYKVKNVILSAGVLGTVGLLLKMKQDGIMPRLSKMLGETVRTNSESIIGVSSLDKGRDFSKGIAITSSVYPDEHTHIEPVRYSSGSDTMSLLAASELVDGGGNVPRWLKYIWAALKSPWRAIKFAIPFGFAKKSIILLVMQTVDNSLRLVRKRRWIWPFVKSVTTEQAKDKKIPTYIPIAHEFARKLAKKINGVGRSAYTEVFLDIPTTAHILGGCMIGESPETGVIDLQNKVFGYKNLTICDGSMVPANLGVNPSLTITTLSERAMTFVPLKEGRDSMKFFNFEKSWGVTDTISFHSIEKKAAEELQRFPKRFDAPKTVPNTKAKKKGKSAAAPKAKKK